MASDYEKRDKEKTRAAKDQAKSAAHQANLQKDANRQQAHHNAEMAHIAQQGVQIQAEIAGSEIEKNQAIAEAEQTKAAAEARLRDKQGEAAIAASVGQLSTEGVARIDDYEKSKEDRENIQQLFDLIGNCIACIELKGKATEHFDMDPYDRDEDEGKEGLSSAYRYSNLVAVRGKLIDLREEVQRVRVWDANQSREDTLAKVEKYLDEARRETTVQAERTVKALKAKWATVKKWSLILAPFTAGISLCIAMDPEGWSNETSKPNTWQDMLEESGHDN